MPCGKRVSFVASHKMKETQPLPPQFQKCTWLCSTRSLETEAYFYRNMEVIQVILSTLSSVHLTGFILQFPPPFGTVHKKTSNLQLAAKIEVRCSNRGEDSTKYLVLSSSHVPHLSLIRGWVTHSSLQSMIEINVFV